GSGDVLPPGYRAGRRPAVVRRPGRQRVPVQSGDGDIRRVPAVHAVRLGRWLAERDRALLAREREPPAGQGRRRRPGHRRPPGGGGGRTGTDPYFRAGATPPQVKVGADGQATAVSPEAAAVAVAPGQLPA